MKLNKWLTENDLTPAQFAGIIGVTVDAINKYIRGRVPKKIIMYRICKTTNYQVMPNDFYDFTENSSAEVVLDKTKEGN